MTEIIQIEGMGCDRCVAAVKQALSEVPGVEVLAVAIGSAEVRYAGDAETARAAAREAVESCGFDVA